MVIIEVVNSPVSTSFVGLKLPEIAAMPAPAVMAGAASEPEPAATALSPTNALAAITTAATTTALLLEGNRMTSPFFFEFELIVKSNFLVQ
jgi:hypothetical protein